MADSSPLESRPNRGSGAIRFPLAWLLALVLVDGTFLGSARLLERPTWAPAVLVIAAVVNVPLFLAALLMLRAKF